MGVQISYLAMKVLVLCLSFLITMVSSQDWTWTCDECEEGGAALANFLSTEEMLAGQSDLVMTEICPQHPDPEYCNQNLPIFWQMLGPRVWETHFSYMCADLQCSAHQTKTGVPSCEACKSGVDISANYLASEQTITAWVTMLGIWCNISPNVTNVYGCMENTEWGIPLTFRTLAEADRSWVEDFCTSWGACS